MGANLPFLIFGIFVLVAILAYRLQPIFGKEANR